MSNNQSTPNMYTNNGQSLSEQELARDRIQEEHRTRHQEIVNSFVEGITRNLLGSIGELRSRLGTSTNMLVEELGLGEAGASGVFPDRDVLVTWSLQKILHGVKQGAGISEKLELPGGPRGNPFAAPVPNPSQAGDLRVAGYGNGNGQRQGQGQGQGYPAGFTQPYRPASIPTSNYAAPGSSQLPIDPALQTATEQGPARGQRVLAPRPPSGHGSGYGYGNVSGAGSASGNGNGNGYTPGHASAIDPALVVPGYGHGQGHSAHGTQGATQPIASWPQQGSENVPVHCSQVKNKEHVFQYTALSDDNWYVLRCPVPNDRGEFWGYSFHPLDKNRAKKHLQQGGHFCHVHCQGVYDDYELVRRFGHRVYGDELSDQWVEESNKEAAKIKKNTWRYITSSRNV